MRKIVFALSVVLTVMTACEDNHDSTVNGIRSIVPDCMSRFEWWLL